MPGLASLKRPVAAGTLALCGWAAAAEAKIVYLDMDVELDQVAPEDAKMFRVGGHDLDRIAYDDSTVDPVTHKVRLTYLGWCQTEATLTGALRFTDSAAASASASEATPSR